MELKVGGGQVNIMARKLTPKQAKFVKEYVNNDGNGTKAALKAYNVKNERTATVIASENLTKPDIQRALLKAAERMGITSDKIMEPVVMALEAEDDKGKPDLDMRLKGHDRIVKLIGGKEAGVQLNIENAKGIEITFKNMGANNAADRANTSGSTTQDA